MKEQVLFGHHDVAAFHRLHQRIWMPGLAPAVFVGAGTSLALGYPSWPTLLNQLGKLAEASMSDDSSSVRSYFRYLGQMRDVTWRAQEYRQAIANDRAYFGFLRRTFRPTDAIRRKRRTAKGATLDALVRLPARHFFTTNYDDEIQEAYRRAHRHEMTAVDWTDPRQAADVMSSWGNGHANPKCIHLHGRISDPASVILTESDYQRAYFKVSGNAQRLAAVLLLHPVLFLGFSLSDPDLMALLRQANMLGFRGSRHFALIGTNLSLKEREVERARYRSMFGIAAIFFNPGKDYSGLRQLVERLAVEPDAPAEAILPKHPIKKSYVWPSKPRNPDDPLKGRFGGLSQRDGRLITGSVKRDTEDPFWFDVEVEVSAVPGSQKRLTGRVDLFMHPTFNNYRWFTWARKGVARFSFNCYGSFTVGALVHKTKTVLELDLAEVDEAPLDFRLR